MKFNKDKFKKSYTFEFIKILINKRLFRMNMVEKLPNEPNLLDFIILPFKYLWNVIKLIISIVLAIVSLPLSLLKSVEFNDIGGIKDKKKGYNWKLDLDKVDYIIWDYDYGDPQDREWAMVCYKKGGFVHWKKSDIIKTFSNIRNSKDLREHAIRLLEKLVKRFEERTLIWDEDFSEYMFFKAYFNYIKNRQLKAERGEEND